MNAFQPLNEVVRPCETTPDFRTLNRFSFSPCFLEEITIEESSIIKTASKRSFLETILSW